MKKVDFLRKMAAALIFAAISFTGCGGGKSSATISMTTEANEVEIMMAGTGAAVINWGDGSTPKTVTLSESSYSSGEHAYTKKAVHRISIDGDGITLLECYSQGLTKLDVSNNTALTSLNCSDNQLTSLDVSNNTALTSLSFWDNQLTSLDVSKNTALTALLCGDNKLTSLDVSKNTALTSLSCHDNELTSLDVTNNTALDILVCNNNKLTAEELNALFSSLHTNTNTISRSRYGFVISLGNNPGTDDCDRSIATDKGWRFSEFTKE